MNTTIPKVKNIMKSEAAVILCDEIFELNFEINKARYLLQEVSENFSAKYESDKKEDHWKIIYEFSRYAAYIEIVSDLLYKVSQTAEELKKLEIAGSNITPANSQIM